MKTTKKQDRLSCTIVQDIMYQKYNNYSYIGDATTKDGRLILYYDKMFNEDMKKEILQLSDTITFGTSVCEYAPEIKRQVIIISR